MEKSEINSYENANVKYNLSGTGYDVFKVDPIDAMDGVKIFSNIGDRYNQATADGYVIHREFNYALVSKNDVKVPRKEFKCYSPKNKKFYSIATKEFDVKVTQMEESTILDKEEYPKTEEYFEDFKSLAIYALVFLSGFITAKYAPTSFAKKNTPYQDIRESKDAKELLFIIMRRYDKKRLQEHCERLSDIVYNNANANEFKKIKKLALKELE